MSTKYRYIYNQEEKYFIKAIGLEDIDAIPENSTPIAPRLLNVSWGNFEPEKRFMDLAIDVYHPAAETVFLPITSGAYLPEFFGSTPTFAEVFVNNYWNGQDWELRNTPLAIEIAKENNIVQGLLEQFFLVEKIIASDTSGKTYYILLHKQNGYETLVSEHDKEWNRELYSADVSAIISFIEFEFEQNENSIPPKGNVFYYGFNSDGSYSGFIEAPLSYGETRRPNPDIDFATDISPNFDLKPPVNSTYFYWNGQNWEIRNTSLAIKLANENKICSNLLTKGYLLIDRKKSIFKEIKIGYWYILWKQEGDIYTIVHSLDKEYTNEEHATYEQSLFEINAIESESENATIDKEITQEEILDSQERWNKYESENKEEIAARFGQELEKLPSEIEVQWENKISEAESWKSYYVDNMKSILDRNYEEDKIFYLFKARIAKEMNHASSQGEP